MKEITIEGVSWNAELLIHKINEGYTQKQFIDHGLKDGKYKNFSYADRLKLLNMVYETIRKTK